MTRSAPLLMAPQKSSEDRLPLVVCGLFLLIGGIFLASGLIWMLQTVLFLGRARLSTAVVVADQRTSTVRVSGRSQYRAVSVMGAPVVLFRDESGASHHFRALASSQQSVQIGERLPILYDPLQPGRASLRSFDALWMRPILLIGFGGVTTGASAWMLSMIRGLQNSPSSNVSRRR